jgi:hypothetical protein
MRKMKKGMSQLLWEIMWTIIIVVLAYIVIRAIMAATKGLSGK